MLVSRIVRLLLAGVTPSEILAITFTRKAAQEMATRLREWLHELATVDDEKAREFLRQREVPGDKIESVLPRARSLFEQLLTHQPPITITTFHSWFLQMLRRAPLDSPVRWARSTSRSRLPRWWTRPGRSSRARRSASRRARWRADSTGCSAIAASSTRNGSSPASSIAARSGGPTRTASLTRLAMPSSVSGRACGLRPRRTWRAAFTPT